MSTDELAAGDPLRWEVAEHAETTSVAALRDELRALVETTDELVFEAVPLCPPGLRPLQDRHGELMPGSFDLALQRLARRAERIEMLLERRAPDVIVVVDRQRAQAEFEEVLQVRERSERPTDPQVVARYAPREDATPQNGRADEADEVVVGLGYTGGVLLVQFLSGLVRTDPAGEVIDLCAPLPSPDGLARAEIRTVSADARYVAFQDMHMSVFDFAERRWLGAWPSALEPWAFEEDNERAVLIDPVRGVLTTVDDLGDYPVDACGSACGCYVWVFDNEDLGGIFQVRDGGLQAHPAAWFEEDTCRQFAVVREDGAIGHVEGVDELADAFDEIDEVAGESHDQRRELGSFRSGAAMALTEDRGFRVCRGQRVSTRDGIELVLGFPYLVAAFNRDGSELVVATKTTLHLIDVVSARTMQRIELAPMIETLTCCVGSDTGG